MKAKVFFIDENDSSLRNGIGRFRDVFIGELHKECKSLDLISLNSRCRDIEVKKCDFGTEFKVPYIAGGFWRYNGVLIATVLRLYIEDDEANVFVINHSPCSAFIQEMKQHFPKSKFVFIIHDQGWCERLLGDIRLLKKIVGNRVADPKYGAMIDYFKEEQMIYSLVDTVVCLSPSTHDLLVTLYSVPPEKCHIIPNGIDKSITKKRDKEDVRHRLGVTSNEKIIMFVGRPTNAKGFDVLLDAINRLQNLDIKFRCVVAGNISGMSDYELKVSRIASRIVFTGHMSEKRLQDWYYVADVGVIPSYTEQCSYAALEMMRAGLLIVSSNGNGLRDMFTHKKNALVAKISSNKSIYAKNLSMAIEAALKMPLDVATEMTDLSRHLIETYYSPRKMKEHYAALFDEIISE